MSITTMEQIIWAHVFASGYVAAINDHPNELAATDIALDKAEKAVTSFRRAVHHENYNRTDKNNKLRYEVFKELCGV